MVAVAVLCHDPLVGRLLDRVSVLAARVLLYVWCVPLAFPQRGGFGRRSAQDAARPHGRQARGCVAAGDRLRSGAARIRARAGALRLRRELRAVPRRRRRRRSRLSQSQRRRLDLGRHARRDRADHPPRCPLRRRECARGCGHAGLRPRRHPQARRCRERRRLRAFARRSARRPHSRSRRRQEGVRRQLRGLPRRGGQGQTRARRPQPDRRHLALRRGSGRPSSMPSGTAAAA